MKITYVYTYLNTRFKVVFY